ncbi:MAG: glycosyltransferase family 4 protein [Candidatus Sumerlaeia bacterium]|nr:glycosyltransferase family 4 protein [Candidatus Sumerlaeia bacterium]
MGEKITVGYDASVTLLPELRGVGRYTLELLREMVLQSNGEFRFVVLLNSFRNKPGERHRFLFDHPDVKVVERSIPGPALLELWKTARQPTWEAFVDSHCDIVHAPSSYIPPTSKPTVATVFDLGFLRDSGEIAHYGGGWFRKMFPHQLPKVDAIITPSRFVARDVVTTYKCREDRVHAIHLGLNHDVFNESPSAGDEETLKKLGLEKGYILAVSDPNPRKRPEFVEQCVRLLRDDGVEIPVVTVGLAQKPPDAPTINLPWISDEELAAVYRRAKAVFLTSREEGFGFPLLEAMACGTPVVAAKHSSLEEIGGELPHWVVGDSPEEYVKAIRTLMTNEYNPELLKAITRHAQKFTWSNCARETLKLYQKIGRKTENDIVS